MDAKRIPFLAVGAFAALMLSCATTPASSPPAPQYQSAASPPSAGSAPQTQAAPPQQSPATSPASPSKESPSPSPSGSQPPAVKPEQKGTLLQKGDILVTKEEFQHTLSDVRRLIDKLNGIIASRDYTAWLDRLTPQYISHYSDPSVLSQISEKPLLKRHDIRLSSLEDYFLEVVVPSRADARVQDLDFIAKNHVRAITIISGKRYILYDLRLVDGAWKIGLS